jgi:ribose 5-phosphate isomerase B
MILGFTSDHRGFKLKEKLIEYYKSNGYKVIDYGTNSTDSCDYPDFAYKLGMGLIKKEVDYGIAICGSGIGISIALNKINGVYCAKVSNKEEALYTRMDNNTNCVSFGENMEFNMAIQIINTFIQTEFSNLEKHIRRINKVKQIENGEYYG